MPNTLWCKDKKALVLPAQLVEKWKALLDENSLSDMALEKAPKGFEGGITKEETEQHFAWRYTGSCARVILSMLDPASSLDEISDAYARIFSGNNIFLTDIPCGSGAATIGILTTLCDLRKNSVLPRHPLNITILAGEISEHARAYFEFQLGELKDVLAEQAIYTTHEIRYWDVLSQASTSDFIKTMTLSSQSCTGKFLVLSNFSGFLEASGKWKKAHGQIEEIFRHARDENSLAIWIEPQKNNVEKLFDRLIDLMKRKFSVLVGTRVSYPNSDWYGKTDCICKSPVREECFSVRLTVIRIDLPKVTYD